MIKALVSVIVLVAAIHTASGRRAGAPLAACISLRPQHNTNVPQDVPSPHIVNLSSFDSMFDELTNTTTLYYTPNTLYSITLVATGVGMFSDVFRGFLLQGRAYADDSVVGTFMPPTPGALYRLSSCQRSDGAVTHNSAAPKTNITVYWMSPSNGTGPIYFGHAFVWRFATFWANLRTAPLLEAGGINGLPPTEATPTQILVTTTPAVVATTPAVVATTPAVVATTPAVVATTPAMVVTTPAVVATPPVVIATPPAMIPGATPTPAVDGENVGATGGTTGLKVSTIMMSLIGILTILGIITN